MRKLSIVAAICVMGTTFVMVGGDSTEVAAQQPKKQKASPPPKRKDPPKTKTAHVKPPKAPKPSVVAKASPSVKPAGSKQPNRKNGTGVTRGGSPNTGTKAGGGKQPELQGVSDQQLAHAFGVLHSVNKTLKMANHDYGGYRAAAMTNIHQAEKSLQLAAKFRGGKDPKGTPGPPISGNQEPQLLSNAQLHSAIPVLHQTIAALERANHDYGGYRRQAIADLHAAMSQLKAALKYVK